MALTLKELLPGKMAGKALVTVARSRSGNNPNFVVVAVGDGNDDEAARYVVGDAAMCERFIADLMVAAVQICGEDHFSEESPEEPIVFTYGSGGALVCDVEIPGVTQQLSDDTAKYYGGKYMVGESITRSAARRLAILLGGVLAEDKSEAADD